METTEAKTESLEKARVLCCLSEQTTEENAWCSHSLGDVRLIPLVEDESDRQINLVFDDVAVVNLDLLFFDPGAPMVQF